MYRKLRGIVRGELYIADHIQAFREINGLLDFQNHQNPRARVT